MIERRRIIRQPRIASAVTAGKRKFESWQSLASGFAVIAIM